jgi:RNA polymerase sigma factor (TIGR02999 family)
MRKSTLIPLTRNEGLAMGHASQVELTALLDQVRHGEAGARDRLARAVYGELRSIAFDLMRRERPGHTLQPSALVNEALIRLFESDALHRAGDRRYLLAAAAQAMRQALVDHARRRGAVKRDGGGQRVPLDNVLAYFEEQKLDVIALHEALDRLTILNQRQASVVVLRFFTGLSVREVAQVLEVSVATVEGDWRIARAWLRGQLGEAAG